MKLASHFCFYKKASGAVPHNTNPMKHLLLIVFTLIGSYVFSQNFSSYKVSEDYNKLLELKKKFGRNNQKWALALNDEFGVDKNGAIHLDYVIESDTTFDISTAMECSLKYFEYAFSNKSSIKRCDYEAGVIIGSGKYYNIGQYNINAIYYAKTVKIHAEVDIIIRFKEGKIRIEAMIRHFNLISGDSLMQGNNTLVTIANAFPCNPKSDNKNAYAMAFINSFANCYGMIVDYVKFMNNNYKDSITIDTNDDW